MNVILLILLPQFVFIEGFGPDSSYKDSNPNSPNVEAGPGHNPSIPLPNLQMRIMSEKEDSIVANVNLKLTERSLANENLPIWILKGEIDSNNLRDPFAPDLVRNNEVMKQLGKFSIYQQPETSSAAVYFHKHRHFDGMIGYDILIRRLSIDVINSESETNRQIGEHGIYQRPKYQGHSDVKPQLPVKHAASKKHRYYEKTYQSRLYDGYPEVLVIVSWDVAKHLTKSIIDESDLYTKIVSYVITLFNGVDMLYSKLKGTKIQINLAGIIIGTEEESFAFLEECRHEAIDKRKVIVKRMDAICTNGKFISFLEARQNEISRDSYDVFVFLTREHLFYMTNGGPFVYRNEHYAAVAGLAHYTKKLSAYKIRNKMIISPATITDKGYYHNYPTIAHELGHLMSLLHDDPPFFTNDGECCGYLLKTFANSCDKCLSWSKTSERSFILFFRSPNCCSFINKPRSLLPPGRHRMLTADEQCQCYGYKYSLKSMEFRTNFCSTNLQCIGTHDEYYRAVIPMDGTPHGTDDKYVLKAIHILIFSILFQI
ncbi:hypothetical protein PV325_009360, partial [Microctonus aethiopoides]